MNKDIFLEKLKAYRLWLSQNRKDYEETAFKRDESGRFLRAIVTPQTTFLTDQEFGRMLQPLWAMKMFRYKISYQVELINNKSKGISIGKALSTLLYGTAKIETRWDDFREHVKGIGTTAMSELLARFYPNEFMAWNPKACEAFRQLGVSDLPKRDKIDGACYAKLCAKAREMVEIAQKNGYEEIKDLLYLNAFFWEKGIFEATS